MILQCYMVRTPITVPLSVVQRETSVTWCAPPLPYLFQLYRERPVLHGAHPITVPLSVIQRETAIVILSPF